MKILKAGLAGMALLAWVAPAAATEITIDLTSGSIDAAPTLIYDLPDSAFTDNGLPVGDLTATAANTNTSANAVRGPAGLGVFACQGFGGCIVEGIMLGTIDGIGGQDSITFAITDQASGFEFILVSATFVAINVGNFNIINDASLSFGGNDHVFDIAATANAQGSNPCDILQGDLSCTVNFVDLIGGGNPFAMSAQGFTFSAPSASDFWYLSEIVWEIGLTAQVPEPASLLVLGAGLLGFGAARRRRV